MRGYRVPRKAGWDCHGLPVELEVERSSASSRRPRSRPTGSPSSTSVPGVGLPLRRGLGAPDRADRLLDRPGRRLRHAARLLHRVGLVVAAEDLGRRPPLPGPQGGPVLPALRHGALLARGGAGIPGRRGPLRLREAAGPRTRSRRCEPGDQLLVWTTTPWTLISNAAVAVGPEIEYVAGPPAGRRRGLRRGRRPLVERVLGEGAEVLDRFPGERARRDRLRAALRLHHRLRAARAHGARGRLRHHRRRHRPGAHRDRLRRGRLPPRRAVRDHAPEPGARRTGPSTSGSPTSPAARSRRPTPTSSRRCASAAACCAPRSTSTPTRTAGAAARRSSTTRSRAGTSAPPTSATGCWPRTRRSAGTPSTSSTGGSASGSRETWTGRSRASATGGRRCRSGSARGRVRGALLRRIDRGPARARRRRPRRPAPPLHRRGHAALRGVRRRDAPRRGGDRRLVRLGLDAVRAVPLPVRGRGAVRRALPGRLHQRGASTRPAAGSTRCSRSRPCSSTRPATATASASG